MPSSNLGIIASSYQVAGGPSAPSVFTYGGTVLPSDNIGRLSFINGTAVLGRAGATGDENWYSADVYTGATAGGTSIDAPWGHYSANGVTIKVGRGTLGTVAVARSLDGGQTWVTELNTASASDYLASAAYANIGGTARWIAPVYGDNDVYLSTNNGDTWTLQSGVIATGNHYAAAFFGTLFGVFRAVTGYYTSPTGTTWTLRSLPTSPGPNSDNFRNFIAGTAELLYHDQSELGGGSVVTYSSTDMINWTAEGTAVFPFTPSEGVRMAYGNGYYVMAGARDESFGDDKLDAFYSSDGGASWLSCNVQSGTAAGVLSLASTFDIAYNDSDQAFYIVAGNRVWKAQT